MTRSDTLAFISRLAGVAVVAMALGACGLTSTVVSIQATSVPTAAPTATATATPAPKAQVVGVSSSAVAVGVNQMGSASAACPSGMPLLSGGYVAHYDTPGDKTGLAPLASYPASNTTWTVTIRTLGSSAHVTAIAVCLQANFAVTMQTVQASTAGPNASVACPQGAVLTGGGVRSATGESVYSQPNGNGWKVESAFANTTTTNPTAYARCATAGLKTGSTQQHSVSVASSHDGTSAVGCPQGQWPTGGGSNGYSPSADTFWNVFHSGPTLGQGNISSGWTTDAYNGQFTSATLTVSLVCTAH